MYKKGLMPDNKLKYWFIFFLMGTIVFAYIMSTTGSTLFTSKAKHGIVSLEIAVDKSAADGIQSEWESIQHGKYNNAELAIINTKWDFGFLFFYSFLIYVSLKWVAQKNNTASQLSRIAFYAAPFALLAGMLDVIENAGMLQTLEGRSSELIVKITYWSSLCKWTLLLLLLFILLISFIAKMVNRKTA